MSRSVRSSASAPSSTAGIFRERVFGRLAVDPQLGDPGHDQLRVDPVLERLNLHPQLAVGIGDLLAQAGGELAAQTVFVLAMRLQLAGELVETHRAEDPLGEEALDDGQQRVLPQVDPLLACVGVGGSGVAVGGPVGAGVVVVVLPRFALHRERLMAGLAANHPGEEVGAVAVARLAAGPFGEARLRALEGLVGDERGVRLLGDNHWSRSIEAPSATEFL
jgi:hypothetical protein